MLVVPRYRYSYHEQPATAAYRSAPVNPPTKKFRCESDLSVIKTAKPPPNKPHTQSGGNKKGGPPRTSH